MKRDCGKHWGRLKRSPCKQISHTYCTETCIWERVLKNIEIFVIGRESNKNITSKMLILQKSFSEYLMKSHQIPLIDIWGL